MGKNGRHMLTGQSNAALDEKSRFLLPSKVREELAAIGGDTSVVYLTKGHDGCLELFPRKVFEHRGKESAGLLQYEQPRERSVSRVLFGGAEKIVLDRQNRILLPERLKKAAQLAKELTLVGVFDRLEVWDRATWESYSEAGESSYDEDAKEVFARRRAQTRPGGVEG